MEQKVIDLNEEEILEYIIEEFFPHGSGFDCDYEIEEKKKTFHVKSSYHCMNEWGGYDGYQDFNIIIQKVWVDMDFKLQFSRGQRKADKYLLREYMEDTLYYHFSKAFEEYITKVSPIPEYYQEVVYSQFLETLEKYGEAVADYLDRPIDREAPCDVYLDYEGKKYKKTFDTYDEAHYEMNDLREKGIATFSFKPTRKLK